jgi:hypothetical protein
MTTLELLIASRARIANGWTQNVPARTANGDPTRSNSPNAVSFCAVGALRAEFPPGRAALTASAALIAALPERNRFSLFLFNDHPNTTQDDVLALYDHAILEAE